MVEVPITEDQTSSINSSVLGKASATIKLDKRFLEYINFALPESKNVPILRPDFFESTNVNIINIDAMYYCADEKNVIGDIRNNPNYTLVKGNLCSEDLINHVLKSYEIEQVVHFAAQSHVQNSFEDSIKFTHDNILGTHILLECSRKYGELLKFIHVSTDEVFGSLNYKEAEFNICAESCIINFCEYDAVVVFTSLPLIPFVVNFVMIVDCFVTKNALIAFDLNEPFSS